MSSLKLEAIREIVADKIRALVDGNNDPVFQNVYEYPNGPAGLDKYPSVVVLPTGGSQGEVKDTGRTLRTFSFEVYIYQEQTPAGKTKEEATEVMTKAIDYILIDFDRDNNLNFEISRMRVVKMEFDFNAQNGPYYIAKLTVDCEVLVQNYQ